MEEEDRFLSFSAVILCSVPIKIAMIRVFERLKKEGLKSKLILQVHDELLIETALEEEEQVRMILEEEMVHASSLAVEREIDLHVGINWYEAK